ncbi:uncharacterized protein YLR464W [Saccharomyces cerevisiae S288C]|uniref:Putative uncharacterized protein YEL076C-A n=2 Tax=Saccharomyces cerevisiae (strain ATCC 204508 / S288c) TaxID=559292 RepID=YE076_YEAST|nr:uncharacterized protein YEL076C-A [Saccharomyces cerevisiae S288C]NP_013569.1 uncharacterized protein YLR464W [Saccharomyces cerevisiae S288C]P0CX16.1 PUTATIVE PSEUDOGENE: RecName: Full=Putative uncharacterized protein YEL076C-A [Saccharomyces cerevisiae S288C]P0CX17.1 PUTATIVE PSEUDOGENE: RecName: Full=Putative uncharacterized protein YLR464W [Saccharomyces cerevisiae S288C]AAB64726.1 Ylr464wp [Saccharomyces cerevisiae]AAB65034.1 Yel076c-ap [Saccharomyces cerevisiae]KAF6740599.1 uncharact|eukprot:NP_010836.1 hypothetical protein YEL076C-A [Saccharomyces cerevisiae S288C]
MQASLPGEKKVDTERLKRDLCPRKPIEIKYFSQICNDMMNKKDRLGDILHIILRACALNFGAGPRGGAGDEEDRSITNEEPIIPSVDEHGLKVCKLRSPNTPRRLRKTLDAVKALLVSSCACTARDLDIFDDNNGVAMWKWIKILYHEVAQETTLKDSYRITLVPSSDGISDTLTVIQSFSYSLLPVLSATYTSMIQQDASNCTLITTRTVHRSLD